MNKHVQRGLVAAGALVGSVGAMAQTVDPGAAVFTDLTTKVTTYGGLAFTLAGVSLGVWIGIKLLKKAANKAT